MVVANEKVVSVIYELRLNGPEGEVIESLTGESPLTFLYGNGGILPKFEENIDGLSIGDDFNFDIETADAYGEVNQDAIVSVPIAVFEINGAIDEKMLAIGNKIPMQDASGNKLTGIIQEVNADVVKMDFNHPLAGNSLHFSGKITEIREATEEELMHGHLGSCSGCGGSCGDHSDGCC